MSKEGIAKVLTLILVFCPVFSHGQADSSVFKALENILELNEDEGENSAYLLEQLESLHQSPINLNRASASEIQNLPIVPQHLLREIYKYREKQVVIHEWQEVYRLLQHNLDLLKILQYICILGDKSLFTKGSGQINEQKLLWSTYGGRKFPTSNGYAGESPSFLGSPWRIATRVRYHSGKKYYAGIAYEKDAGEMAFRSNTPQFMSAFLELREINTIIKRVILGDFQFIAGQGLNNGNSFALGRSLSLESGYQGINQIKPHSSTNEWHFHRGLAFELQQKNFHFLTGISRKNSRLDSNKLLPNLSGYYRSTDEINKYAKGRVSSIMNYGYYQNHWSKIGAGISTHKKGVGNKNEIHQQFSVDASIYMNTGLLFAEISKRNHIQDFNLLIGGTFAYNNEFQFSILIRRWFDEALSPYHAVKFQKSADKETGTTLQLKYLLSNTSTLSLLYDRYLSTRENQVPNTSSPNQDLTLQYDLRKRRNYHFYMRGRYRDIQVYRSSTTSPRELHFSEKRIQGRLHLDKDLKEHVQYSSRIELKNSGRNNIGMLLFQQFQLGIGKHIEVVLRATWFSIEDFDNRIYAFEPQVPFIYSLPAHYGQGQRSLIKVKMSLSKGLSAWIRFTHTQYNDRIGISSGENTINSNQLRELHFCLKKSF